MNNIASYLNCCSVRHSRERETRNETENHSPRKKSPKQYPKSEKYSRIDYITYPILGLDDSGKTSILKRWQPNHTISYDGPTVGANTEKLRLLKTKRIYWRPKKRRMAHTFILRDLAGSTSSRLLWNNHCRNIGGIFYTIDCSNHSRISESEQELKAIVNSLENSNIPIVIMANKQDKENSLTVVDLVVKLRLDEIKNPVQLIPTSAVNSLGLSVALESMKRMSREYRKQQRKAIKEQRKMNSHRLSYLSPSITLYDSSESLNSLENPLDDWRSEGTKLNQLLDVSL